jgi:hypothetical protein
MIRVEPILDGDLHATVTFMRQHLNPSIGIEAWENAFRQGWAAPGANHGFMLRDGGEIVGVIGAIRATMRIGGERVELCNLTSLSVVPRYRARTMDLFAHCLADATLQFTNFTPNQAVERMSRLMRFRQIDPVQYVMVHAPLAWPPGRLASLPEAEAEAALPEEALTAWRHHRVFPWIEWHVFAAGGRACLLLYRRQAFTKLRLKVASVLHVSDPEFFLGHAPAIGAQLLWRRGLAATLIDRRMLPARPPRTQERTARQVRLFKGRLADPEIPLIYSELAALPL